MNQQIFSIAGVIKYPELKNEKEEIKGIASDLGFKFYLIEQDIKSKHDLLEAFYQACEFPDYFGFNWDALKDCLFDYSFAPAKGYIFGLSNSSRIQKKLGSDFKVFLEIFADASESWKVDNVPFNLLLG